jgi:hypothetical protein
MIYEQMARNAGTTDHGCILRLNKTVNKSFKLILKKPATPWPAITITNVLYYILKTRSKDEDEEHKARMQYFHGLVSRYSSLRIRINPSCHCMWTHYNPSQEQGDDLHLTVLAKHLKEKIKASAQKWRQEMVDVASNAEDQ